MRSEIFDLIESVRALGLRVTKGKKVRTDLDAPAFEAGLLQLHDALALVDGTGAIALQVSEEDLSRKTIKTVVTWLEEKKIDFSDLGQEIRRNLIPHEARANTPKTTPRYVSLDMSTIDYSDPVATEEAVQRISSVLQSIRGDVMRLSAKVSAADALPGEGASGLLVQRLRELEDKLQETSDLAAGAPAEDTIISPSEEEVVLIRSVNDRIAEMGEASKGDPKFKRLMDAWQSLVGDLIMDNSLTKVSMSYSNFVALNRVMREILIYGRDAAQDESITPVPRP